MTCRIAVSEANLRDNALEGCRIGLVHDDEVLTSEEGEQMIFSDIPSVEDLK